jgi:hypothetical protein
MAWLQQSGLAIELPEGWEGRIFTRSAQARLTSETTGFEPPLPVLHAANFALPAEVDDFGGGAVELMEHGHVFFAVVDFGSEAAETPLFASQGVPRPLRINDFDPLVLQRTLAGQSGVQRFFNSAGRGLCLYVVAGSHRLRFRLVPLLNEALGAVSIS